MDQNVNYYGIILLLRQLRESGRFSEKELRRVAARIAADSVITASSITSREHDSTPASASMMSPMTAADMAGVSIAMSSSAPPLLSIPVARTTPVGPADSPRQRGRLLCGVPYGAGQFGDLAWGHG